MAFDDPFFCKRCHGHAPYAGHRDGDLVYRCRSCGAENLVASKTAPAQQQQQPQLGPKED